MEYALMVEISVIKILHIASSTPQGSKGIIAIKVKQIMKCTLMVEIGVIGIVWNSMTRRMLPLANNAVLSNSYSRSNYVSQWS